MEQFLRFLIGPLVGGAIGLGMFLLLLWWPRSEPIEFEGGGLQFCFFMVVFGGGSTLVGATIGSIVWVVLNWVRLLVEWGKARGASKFNDPDFGR